MYKYMQICIKIIYIKEEKVISTYGIKKEIIKNNVKMKNNEYKIKRRKLHILQRK